MDLFSIFKGSKYFDKHIEPKCDYCRFGKRAKDGNKVLCEKRGLVDANYSCGKFLYSPLKRIPVKQLNFVGSLADEDLYIESAGDRAEKEEELKKNEAEEKKATAKKTEEKAEDKPAEQPEVKPDDAPEGKAEDAPAAEAPEAVNEAPAETPEVAEAPVEDNGSAE
jgi:hypothetical protein